MQQSPQMFPMVPSIPPGNITTEQIQKYLDENKKLIMAIMENQNLGKLAECAQYQALLQKNLMYLAAIADAQPPPPTPGGASPSPAMASQMTTPHPGMQPPGYYMQAPPGMASAQQASPAGGIFPPRGPLQFGNSPHHLQDPQQQQMHQQAMQMGMRPMSLNNNNGMMPHHPMQQQQQPETTGLGGGSSGGGGSNVGLRGNKQDGGGGGGGDGQGKDDGK